MQSRVDDYYQAFVKAVAKGRGVSNSEVTAGMGQGRVLGAQTAESQRMVDGVTTFERLLGSLHKRASTSSTSQVLRQRRLQHALTEISLMQ
jgi:ClpP class serine protease